MFSGMCTVAKIPSKLPTTQGYRWTCHRSHLFHHMGNGLKLVGGKVL